MRYADLVPCYNAFVDCRTPGSEAKENFTIIGPGVSENPAQHVHIAEPHGYNIGGARQPPGCVNSQHSHDTAEVFVVHSGHWRFDLGEHGDDAQVALAPGDVISIPTQVFRGFTATAPADDGSPGFLWAVLGQDDPGRVMWAPHVFDLADKYGLVLLENGSLVDTVAGETMPADINPLPPTTREQAASLQRLTDSDAASIIVRAADVEADNKLLIGKGAPLDWPHGFTLERIACNQGEPMTLGPDADKPMVLFVHRGSLEIDATDGSLTLNEGDTISLLPGPRPAIIAGSDATVFAVEAQ